MAIVGYEKHSVSVSIRQHNHCGALAVNRVGLILVAEFEYTQITKHKHCTILLERCRLPAHFHLT